MATTVTVPGAQSTTITETYGNTVNLTVAQQIANALAAAQTGNILTVSDFASQTAVPGGNVGELAVTTPGGGDVVVGEGYSYVAIDQTVTGPVTIAGAASVFAGTQNITYEGVAGVNPVDLTFAGGDNTVALPTGTTYTVGLGNGNDTVYGDGTGTITGGTGTSLFFSNGDNLINSGGNDTIIAGAGATTVTSTGADPLLFGGSGSLVYIGEAAGNPTVTGGTGTATLFGADGQNLTYFDGTGAGSDKTILAAGAGSETLNAGGSHAGVQMAVGSGSDVITGSTGNDVFYGGAGAATITGNGGLDAFIFGNTLGHTGGTVTITDWTSSDNFVTADYGTTAAQDALNTATVSGGSLTAQLSDGTTIVFQNITDSTQIHNQSFGTPPPVA